MVPLNGAGSAITSDTLTLEQMAPGTVDPTQILGTVRARVTATDPARSVFVGIAPAAALDGYLSGARYSTVRTLDSAHATYTEHSGSTILAPPASQPFWAASASGTGTQSVTWTPRHPRVRGPERTPEYPSGRGRGSANCRESAEN